MVLVEGLPIWLRIGLAAIPLVAAIIAGVFALLNTVNRRVERLKNLTEICSKLPEGIAPPYALELVMLRELKVIDQKTTPKSKWDRRIHAFFYVSLPIGAALSISSFFIETPVLNLVGTALLFCGGTAIFVFVVVLNAHVGSWRARGSYTIKINELETKAGIRREND